MVTIYTPGEAKDIQIEAMNRPSKLNKASSNITSLIASQIRESLRNDLREISNIDWGKSF